VMMFSALRDQNINLKNVVAVYSELEPCSNCAGTLRQLLPNAKVLWSFPYNNGRGQRYLDGKSEKLNALETLGLNRGFTF
jgi:Xanthomonas XOO_2897-like deaminase